MSRTYRSVAHFVNKESLIKDFNEGLYRIFYSGGTFHNAAHYARAAMAKERSDAAIFGKGLLSEVTGISHNGSPLGYREWNSSRWAKRSTNKVRRSNDRSVIAEAMSDYDDEITTILEDSCSDYDEWMFDEEESPWDDEEESPWDDDNLPDDYPSEDACWDDDRWDVFYP